jgi:hypothetical protein
VNSKILAVGEIQGNLYVLNIVKEHVNVAKQQPDTDQYLWHCRLGHPGMNNANKLIDENIVSGMDGVSKTNENQFCEACIKVKHHRCPYPKTADYRASDPFKLVHSDVCGPMSVPSFGGYCVTLRYWNTNSIRSPSNHTATQNISNTRNRKTEVNWRII